MAKHMICQTVICKVNGITLLDLNCNHNEDNGIGVDDKDSDHSIGVSPDHHIKHTIEDNGIEVANDSEEDDSNASNEEDLDEDWKTTNEEMETEDKEVFEIEKVENGIESVRKYVKTTRKNGKVWHLCNWKAGSCAYGSKWSGAMVNHIRSHLGVKPFRCSYCSKYFTIACNLKNHLRIHHNLKARIVSNGGRRRKLKERNRRFAAKIEKKAPDTRDSYGDYGPSSKLRIFKPSFINGKVENNTVYAPQSDRRYGPKRKMKKTQRYVDYEEDYDEEEEEMDEEETEYQVNDEVAEEENRMFYEQTNDEREDGDEELSQYIVKRRYNKKLWFVCLWNPRQCKYRSHLRTDVCNHLKKHKNIQSLFTCNWNHCSQSFADNTQLASHQLIHRQQKPFQCHFPNCFYSTVNDRALKMHKIRHKRNL